MKCNTENTLKGELLDAFTFEFYLCLKLIFTQILFVNDLQGYLTEASHLLKGLFVVHPLCDSDHVK